MGQTKRDYEDYINSAQYQLDSAEIDKMISILRRSYEARTRLAKAASKPLQLTFEDIQYLDIKDRLDWHYELNVVAVEMVPCQ